MPFRLQRRYAPHVRDLVSQHGDLKLAIAHGVPRSTAAGWLRSGPRPLLTLDDGRDRATLHAENLELRRQLARAGVLLKLLLVVIRVLGLDFHGRRILERRSRERLLRAITSAREHFSLRRALRLIRLSPSRFHEWSREPIRCGIAEVEDCPRRSPTQLTPDEILMARELVTGEEHRHLSTDRLAILAQRTGRLFVSASTLHRLIRARGWKRPRRRLHPKSPRQGIAASRPNETWHIDTTVIRLVDGTKLYLHAVLDNFSRRILAWRLACRFEVASTLAVLHEAGSALAPTDLPTVLADGGSENFNASVDALLAQGRIRRVLAQVDVRFSNSMIEAWWRSLKHQWLFLHELANQDQVEQLVHFYVEQHNTVIPHAAFRGQTPDEMYFGTGGGVFEELELKKVEARKKRLEANRAMRCATCVGGG